MEERSAPPFGSSAQRVSADVRSAVTVSLVDEARGGPFVYWNDLKGACRGAAELGFDAVEIFPPAPEALAACEVKARLAEHGLQLAAVGTGAGWVRQRLTLTDADETVRRRARDFVGGMIDAAGELGAPAIIGSMQGRFGGEVSREQALNWLGESICELAKRASAHRVPLLLEPLNRYETNLLNTLPQTVSFLSGLQVNHVRILADLFHMNIEELSLAGAIREAGKWIGHVHLADSNRRPAGFGHTDFGAVGLALREIQFRGYVSAEALPYPDSDGAAAQTMASFRKLFA